ncbi:MAG TPA: energy-coupling factor transporter ATPase [Candidatus Sulfomarinibacteraceae bacterium]|nr:energy-coupling factor transporter ATPase [Candidatus Sulfomarinibacteraceae bacterium]
MITVENLSYTYPDEERPVLRDVSLAISAGEFVLLTGPSGAGKSTLLRTLSGLVPHFSGGAIAGRIRVAGKDPIAAGPQQMSRTVGMVFQNPEAQSVVDRVEADVAFALENAAVPPAEMRIRVEEALNLLELAPLRDRALHTLSGGERQRAAIAAALALRPRVLVLDEPTSQLDPQAAADVLGALVRLNEDVGLTIVLCEHRLERVVRYAERVVALERGAVVADGPVPDILERLPQLPPLSRLGRELGWNPLPLTVKQGRTHARRLPLPPNGDGVSLNTGDRAPQAGSNRPLLEARNVRFAYDRQPVLRGIDLTVREGEAVALMGRNGSGKSTLLKCLVGLLRAQQGEVQIEGEPIAGRSVADVCRRVAYLPQAPDDLLFAETVRDELETTLRNHGLRNGSGRIDALLQRLGLMAHAGAYPRDLSVGERQRVALGAVTITEPALLLLDEPTRGLDYAAKEQLVALWRGWQRDGLGLLLVTHDVELAAQVAQRVIILGDGEVIADGPAGQVLGSSPLFAPQIARLFPSQNWLTVEDALGALAPEKV